MVLLGCIFNSVMDYCNYKKYKETNIKTKEINVDPLWHLRYFKLLRIYELRVYTPVEFLI